MKRIKISGGVVITPHRTLQPGYVVIENGKITEVGQGDIDISDCETIDAGGRFVSPGFIDIHTHGAGGHDFMDGAPEAFLGAARMQAVHGATMVYPTTVTSDDEFLLETFTHFRTAQTLGSDGAILGGLHIEGPYFASAYQGAQDPRYLRKPRPCEYNELLERGKGVISRWSLAPELDGALPFGRKLLDRGIIPAIAHTGATYEQAVEAYENGFRLMVHFFSCMSTITRKKSGHRIAGVVEAGYALDGMDVEIIGDGIHVYPPLLKLVYKIKGPDHIALVSDSMRAAGMPPEGSYILGSLKGDRTAKIEDGVAKLPDGSAFASSIVTMDTCVRNMYRLGEVPLSDAVKMASTTPARIMGADTKGSLSPGKDADIVIFDDNIDICMTMIGGRVVYRGCTQSE